ncbi:MAG: DUF711 family protein [Rhodothermales bacterium]|nr:DUF711 family protein [Rhodothermales bacterium]
MASMTDIRSLVDSIANALGPDAPVETVERVARLFITQSQNGPATSPERYDSSASHLKVAAVSIGISLLDCSSRLPRTVSARAYDKIRRVAGLQRQVLEHITERTGAEFFRCGLSVSPVAVILDSGTVTDFIQLASSIEQAAVDVDADFVSGFSAIVNHGVGQGAATLIKSLPDSIVRTERLTSSVLFSAKSGSVNLEAIAGLAASIEALRSRKSEQKNNGRVFALCNTDGYSAGLDASFHCLGDAELTINLQMADDPASELTVEQTDAAATALASSIADTLSKRSGYTISTGRILRGTKSGGTDSERLESVLDGDGRSIESLIDGISRHLSTAHKTNIPAKLICLK